MPPITTHQFHRDAAQKASDDAHRQKISRAIASYETAVTAMKSDQFRDWQTAREQAARLKDYVLENLPALLEQFEAGLTERGVEVLWARDASEAREQLQRIIARHDVRRVVKSKSMTTEELELNEFLEHNGVSVWESDLGELIVQLANEKPYHIVTPAMHKSKEEISKLFVDTLGIAPTEDAEELTMAARRHLRKIYTEADLGITGANFLIAEEAAVAITENEGNARLTFSCPRVHVAIAGIEKVLPSMNDLALFFPLLATSGTGQRLTTYNSVIRGPRQTGRTAAGPGKSAGGPIEPDGPDHMYVILLDNGRSSIYAQERFRESLRCIRCGACLNACPVYRTVGGHTYGTTYQGPIGSVITPHLRGMEAWNHLSHASSLCGACTEVCPVQIDLHHMLLHNREEVVRRRASGFFWRAAMKLWAILFRRRWRIDLCRRVGLPFQSLLRLFVPPAQRKRVPRLARRSFRQLWREHE